MLVQATPVLPTMDPTRLKVPAPPLRSRTLTAVVAAAGALKTRLPFTVIVPVVNVTLARRLVFVAVPPNDRFPLTVTVPALTSSVLIALPPGRLTLRVVTVSDEVFASKVSVALLLFPLLPMSTCVACAANPAGMCTLKPTIVALSPDAGNTPPQVAQVELTFQFAFATAMQLAARTAVAGSA